MKKFLSIVLVLCMALALMAGCNGNGGNSDAVLKVAAIETAYGAEMWTEICNAFTAETGIEVQLTTDKNLEDVLSASMQGGEYPDVIHLATGRPAALTEQFIKDKNITEITDVLSMTIPGEKTTVGDKLVGGFTDTSLTNPYGDGKTYLAPMFYSPCGLFYNAGLFQQKGWEVPTTWDEMWALGDVAKAEGIALFTYPTAGYYDAFTFALMNTVGGPEFFQKATNYEEGIWETQEGKAVLDILVKMASYTDPITPTQANNGNFLMNQQMILDNKALFMPNGTWVEGEMADAPRAEGFQWGLTALPALTEGGDRYSTTFIEQAWIPAGAENVDMAKQFVAFLYSDKACEIFAAKGAIQPVPGVDQYLEGNAKTFYSIYNTGAKAAMGGFASFNAVAGGISNAGEVFFNPIDSLVSGTLTADEYIANIIAANDVMRANKVG